MRFSFQRVLLYPLDAKTSNRYIKIDFRTIFAFVIHFYLKNLSFLNPIKYGCIFSDRYDVILPLPTYSVQGY